jgi:cobalamin biosynthesis Mg chelatase CobN
MLRRQLVLLCALVAAAFAVTAPVAVAQEPGVTIDPGSPTGKEYAIPVQSARQQAAKSKKKKKANAPTPLFGEGVDDNRTGAATPPATTPKKATTSNGSSRTKRADRKAAERAAADARARAAATQAAAAHQLRLERARELRAQASTPDGGIGVGGIVGLGVAVLLVGGLIGLWLRRRAATT